MPSQAAAEGAWDWTWDGFVWGRGLPGHDWRVPVFSGLGYLAVIHMIQWVMKDRKPLQLRGLYAAHNWLLAAFSLVVFIGQTYETIVSAQESGAKSIICQNDNAPPRGRLYYWAYIFYISKYYEFADTIFLALKKKPLEFLHCYHHAIVPTGCWLGLAGWKLPLSTGTICNSFVHTIMYYYYGASQLGIRVSWKRYITIVQILQFCSGGVLTLMFAFFYFHDLRISETASSFSIGFTKGCAGDLHSVAVVAAINVSFLALFVSFYSKTYKAKVAAAKAKTS